MFSDPYCGSERPTVPNGHISFLDGCHDDIFGSQDPVLDVMQELSDLDDVVNDLDGAVFVLADEEASCAVAMDVECFFSCVRIHPYHGIPVIIISIATLDITCSRKPRARAKSLMKIEKLERRKREKMTQKEPTS